jgi:hypothetical protein
MCLAVYPEVSESSKLVIMRLMPFAASRMGPDMAVRVLPESEPFPHTEEAVLG